MKEIEGKVDVSKQKEIPNIDLRSDEVQEIMGHKTPLILRGGITIILFFVILFLMSTRYIRYPEYINFNAQLLPNVEVLDIMTPEDGSIVSIIELTHCTVKRKDTLAVIETIEGDTFYIESPQSGKLYIADYIVSGMEVRKGDRLFSLVKRTCVERKAKCIAYVSFDMIQLFEIGQSADVTTNGSQYKMFVESKAVVPNKEGTFFVLLSEYPNIEGNEKRITDERLHSVVCNVKMKVSDETIFNKFFANKWRLHI